MGWLVAYLDAVRELLLDLWAYMLLGFLVAGLVEEFVPTRWLLRYFGGHSLPALFRAAGAGFVVSACSCGAIPLAASLRDRGASPATILTFLLASPWLGIPMLLVYVSFLGWGRTVGLIALSIAVAIVVGLILAALERRGRIATPAPTAEASSDGCSDGCGPTSEDNDGWGEGALARWPRRLFLRVPRHAWDLGKDIGLYLLAGMLLVAVAKAYVADKTIATWLGLEAGVGAVLLALPLSVAVEACSEGMAVIGGQLYEQGASLAVVFVLSMVGVATDFTELSVVWKKFGGRTTVTYLALGTGLTVAAALGLQVAGKLG